MARRTSRVSIELGVQVKELVNEIGRCKLAIPGKGIKGIIGMCVKPKALYPYWESMVGDPHSVFVETFQVQVQAWKMAKHVVSCHGLVSPVGQVIRCVCSGELERVKVLEIPSLRVGVECCNVTMSAERVRGVEKWIKEAFGARNGLSEQETEFRSLVVQSSMPRRGTWRLSVQALGQNADIPRLGMEAYA
ncbi:hypothetical protein PIB30_092987 [Stylosanthes scabra]|uniref:Uncharacterized protein n=1 Tax=Stylosanthes scabra TaxID=79078 RepID=A0ABU6QVK8_9FABA|nr:hypothetical protein [Stylosanthes scabra]